jgi:hypothetical protein
VRQAAQRVLGPVLRLGLRAGANRSGEGGEGGEGGGPDVAEEAERVVRSSPEP